MCVLFISIDVERDGFMFAQQFVLQDRFVPKETINVTLALNRM